MYKSIRSVAIPERLDDSLSGHLIREDGQEDLVFALWTPSEGSQRLSALLHTLIPPESGDREVHGNVHFNPQYYERAVQEAMAGGYGLAFLHSHPFPGWQGMSPDDVIAETKMASSVEALTGFSLLGLTTGSDGTWSARFWEQQTGRRYRRRWCHSVRVVGKKLKVDFNRRLVEEPQFGEMFRRTVTVWGKENHKTLARLRIGIAGLGSVGSVVAETLARSGMQYFTLIDFDEVQEYNLDRLLIATVQDISELKVIVAERRIKATATASTTDVRVVPYSLAEKQGYDAALDCDVIFCCVDRPRPRHILNHMAYAHLIPVVDGGIAVRLNDKKDFKGADWQLQTVAPGRPCLECLETYNNGDVSLEEEGLLDDPSYMQNLPENHRLKRNENIFAFSANLGSLEVMQLIELVTGIGGMYDVGVQRFRYNPGILETDVERICAEGCIMNELTAQADRPFTLWGRDLTAEAARRRQGRPLSVIKQ